MEVTNTVAAYHVWTAPDGRIEVHLRLDVIDRMLPEILAAFAAIPRRGAETGGILLGKVDPGKPTVIRVEDFEPVVCSHKLGPSFLFSELDYPNFETAALGTASEDSDLRPIGYYRSHTREVQAIEDEDRSLCVRFFPAPTGIALIVRPYASRVCEAGFLTYENGRLPDWPRTEFPFSSAELERLADPSLPSPQRRPLGVPAPGAIRERNEPAVPASPISAAAARARATAPAPAPEPQPLPVPTFGLVRGGAPRSARRTAFMLLPPMAVLLLCAGVLLGYIAARSFLAPMRPAESDPFVIGLTATPEAGSLVVRWDRSSAAAHRAERAVLGITEDGQPERTVTLSGSEVQTGTVVFAPTARVLAVRLEIFLDGRHFVGQTVAPAQ